MCFLVLFSINRNNFSIGAYFTVPCQVRNYVANVKINA